MIFKYKFNNAYFFNLSNNTKKKKKKVIDYQNRPCQRKKKAEIEGQFGEGERRLRKRIQHSNIK